MVGNRWSLIQDVDKFDIVILLTLIFRGQVDKTTDFHFNTNSTLAEVLYSLNKHKFAYYTKSYGLIYM